MSNLWEDCGTKCPGVLAAGIFDREGMMVDGFASDPRFNLEHAAATFVAVVRESQVAGDFLKLDAPRDVQVTFQDLVVILRPVPGSERGLSLGLTAKADVPLGRIRMYMDLLAGRLPALTTAAA
jgi:predicted regulator of Ras-like GTPase activity (Roadblock/LC7/MglB family)